MTFNPLDLWHAGPLVAVVSTGLLVLLIESFWRNSPGAARLVSLAGLMGAAILTVLTYGSNGASFNNSFVQGPFGSFCSMLFIAAGFVTILVSQQYLVRMDIHRAEYYSLLLFAIAGMMLMASGVDLIIIFLGIELMSLCLYVLAGFQRTNPRSNEASLKYFLLGAFVTGFLLYGIALIYGVTGTTNLPSIARHLSEYLANPLFLVGAGLIAVSLSFKIAAAPFHLWAPDVYEGAPTTVTAFMSTGAKAAAFAAFIAVFLRAIAVAGTKLSTVLAVIAAGSMIIGNVTAIAQSNIKRMLAYSSVAHAGYMLSGIAAGNAEGQVGILFYLAAYIVMNLGAFSVVTLLEREKGEGLTFDTYEGLSGRQPFLAASMAMLLFALAGIPPFAGFFGKYYVFLAVVKADLVWLAIIGVLTSLISAYYYLRIVVLMYFREGQGEAATASGRTTLATIGVLVIVVLGLGLYPSIVLDFAQRVF